MLTPRLTNDHAGRGVVQNEKDARRRAFAEALRAALKPIVDEVRHDLPQQMTLMFLLIASYPGRSVKEYAQLGGVSTSVASRHILDLGDRNRRMGPGFGLVMAKPSPMELRRHEVYLTPKGEALITRMQHALERTYRSGH
jgi:DNA-binding MarR family transcriptional regulator